MRIQNRWGSREEIQDGWGSTIDRDPGQRDPGLRVVRDRGGSRRDEDHGQMQTQDR